MTRHAKNKSGTSDERTHAILSHAVWMGQSPEKPFQVTAQLVEWATKEDLPTPAEQLDLYILYLGDQLRNSPSTPLGVHDEHLRAKIGAATEKDVAYIKQEAASQKLIDFRYRLNIKGWERYEELKRGKAAERTAFMAMPFGNPSVVRIVEEKFKRAVEQTGFRLKRVDEEQPAGLIDNQIRVKIRLCRFVIADLTGGNNGAYWEAGYAEGLGKPVIYTCSKAEFDPKTIHFDTNHCTTIPWDLDAPDEAADRLKATIRATLQGEAKMTDE